MSAEYSTEPPTAKTERLELRLTAEQKRIFKHAAGLLGRSLTDFVVASIQQTALQAIQEHHVLELSLRDRVAFFEAVASPPEPSERMRELATAYREYTNR